MYWYPRNGNIRVYKVLNSEWGRLFHNWEKLTPDEKGWQEIGEGPPGIVKGTGKLLSMAFNILKTCIKEAPEIAARKRRREITRSDQKSNSKDP